jgi:hypothetical protein
MASDREQLLLNELDLNDGITFSMEELTFTPAQAKPKWAENPNSSSVILVEEPQFSPSTFELTVRVVPAKDTDAALAAIGTLMDKLQSCARTEEGVETLWTPNEASTTYTAYTQLGELLEVPITVDGDLAGWFVEAPLLKIKLTNRPFLYGEERVVLAPVESSLPFQTAFIKGIKGDVPAEGRMVIRDKATKVRRYAEWGQDAVLSEAENPTAQIKADNLVATGFAGELATRTGTYSTKAMKASLVATPVTICSTANIANIGSYKLKLRVEATGGAAQIRAAYRVGEGPLTTLSWVEVPGLEDWFEIDLREMFIEAAEKGEQVTQILLQGKSAEGSTVYLDILDFFPTRRYGVARGPAVVNTPSSLNAYDTFKQTAGNLAGKVAEIGGTWAGAGDADDFTLNTGFAVAQRTALSDAAGVPRYALLGTNEYSDIYARIVVRSTNPYVVGQGVAGLGLMLRYVDTNNWARLYIKATGIHVIHENPNITEMFWRGFFQKKVAGVLTTYPGSSGFGSVGPNGGYDEIFMALSTEWTPETLLQAMILSDGTFAVGAKGETYLTGNDPVFATGGALAKGKIGFVDEKTSTAAETRYYDAFVAWQPQLGIVCNSGKTLEVRPATAEREDPTGKFWSPVPEYRGSDFYLDPAGKEGLINKLAVKMRRADIRVEPTEALTDKQSLEVLARERFIVPR